MSRLAERMTNQTCTLLDTSAALKQNEGEAAVGGVGELAKARTLELCTNELCTNECLNCAHGKAWKAIFILKGNWLESTT